MAHCVECMESKSIWVITALELKTQRKKQILIFYSETVSDLSQSHWLIGRWSDDLVAWGLNRVFYWRYGRLRVTSIPTSTTTEAFHLGQFADINAMPVDYSNTILFPTPVRWPRLGISLQYPGTELTGSPNGRWSWLMDSTSCMGCSKNLNRTRRILLSREVNNELTGQNLPPVNIS